MENEEFALKGKVFAVYGSINRFADACGWSISKTSRIVNNQQEPTGSEIETMADALKVSVPAEIRYLFLRKSTQDVDCRTEVTP